MNTKIDLLEILEKVYNKEITPTEAENIISGLKTVNKSTLIEAIKGDRVKCLYGNPDHKIQAKLLDKHPTIDKIQLKESTGICRFTFLEDESQNWFWEKDFLLYNPESV